jgi:hypothetical protein
VESRSPLTPSLQPVAVRIGSLSLAGRNGKCSPLLVAGVEDRRPIAGPDVVALAIARAWVVNLEEELEDLPVADARRIKDYLDYFGV